MRKGSVELAPSNARYRWALVLSLKKLGRAAEAREHAERLLQIGPDIAAAYRERIERLYQQGCSSTASTTQPETP